MVKLITSEPVGVLEYIGQIWHNRALIKTLFIRDIKVQYAQTMLGFLWAILQPLIALIIYSLFFYKIIGINTGNVPYPLFVLPGILAWFNFTKIINESGAALVNNKDLIRKLEFPKIILLISKLLIGLVDVTITLVLFFIAQIIFGYPLQKTIVFLPFFLLINQLLGFSVALWLSALTIRYRDFFHVIPFIISFGIWITPVFYPTTILPAQLEYIMAFNPLAAVAGLYRWSLLDYPPPPVYYLWSLIPALLLLISGFRYFLKIESEIVDFV